MMFFFPGPLINTCWMNEIKRLHPHIQWHTSWQSSNCRRKTRLASSTEGKEPELHPFLHRTEWCEHGCRILTLWHFQLHAFFFYKHSNRALPKTMPLCQQWSRNCWRDSERKNSWEKILSHCTYSFICLFIHPSNYYVSAIVLSSWGYAGK